MSEQLAATSLAGLASPKGTASRDAADTGAATGKNRVSDREGFDGLLKSFLGKDTAGARSEGGQAAKRNDSPSHGRRANAEKSGGFKAESSRETMRTPGNDGSPAKEAADAPEEFGDEAVAAAALEAARLIWGILYGFDAAFAEQPALPADDALARIAQLLEGMGQSGITASGDALSGLGVAGIDVQALAGAVETANASAEMNNAAVRAALEELLDGMPREALREALAKTAGELGLEGEAGTEDLVDELARALGLESVDREDSVDPERLLSELARRGTAPEAVPEGDDRLVDVYAGRQRKEIAAAAENSGTPDLEAEVFGRFTDFLKEKIGENAAGAPINETDPLSPEQAEALLDEFADWLRENGNSKEIKALAGDRQTLGRIFDQVRATANDAAAAELEQAFSEPDANLENSLQTEPEVNAGETPDPEPAADATTSAEAAPETDPATAKRGEPEPEVEAEPVKAEAKPKEPQAEGKTQTEPAAATTPKTESAPAGTAATQPEPGREPKTETPLDGMDEAEVEETADPKPATETKEATGTAGATEQAKGTPGIAAGDQAKDGGFQMAYGSQNAQAAPAAAQTGASANPSGQGGSVLEQIENIERIAQAVRMANRGGVKSLTLQLSPPELGKVSLRVVSREGVVSAYLRVEKTEAAAQLAGNLSQLRENLKAQGIELGELDIRQQQHNQAAGDFSGHRHKREAEAGPESGGGLSGDPLANPEGEDAAAEAVGAASGPGGLNLFA